MNTVLLLAVVVLAVLLVLHRRKTRQTWRQIGGIIEAIEAGRRPPSFILHGEEALWRIGLGLEKLADHRDRLERQISQEEFNLQAILSSMGEGVMILDTERRIRLVNSSFLKLFGLDTAPLGKSVLQAVRQAAVDEVIRDALGSGATETRELTLAGSGKHLSISASPVRDSRGATLGVAAIFHDISLIRQLEQIRREFVANVSHELRTPLSIFQGYLEMLIDHPELPREEVAETLGVLQKHSSRLNLLVEDLLTLARLEARRDEFNLASVSLEEILRAIEVDWKLKFAERKVRFALRVSPGLPPLMADAFRLEQVFNNLLENALKYTPEGGEVEIEAAMVPASDADGGARFGEIEVKVRDSGSGIPPGDLPHIFERFYRADKARSRHLGGTGLGLSIVKHLVHAHGGTVRAESVHGLGTTIFVTLPAAPLLAAEPPRTGEA